MTSATVTLLGLVSAFSAPVEGESAAVPPPSDEPLLVVVERNHGATASPEAVRHAISEELHRRVVGPTDAAGKSATQMLVVTLAPDSVAIQMRAAGDGAAPRRIQPLAAGESSLRVVAWLAGNLARDQVSELMDALPAAPVAAAQPPSPAPAQPPPAAVEPAVVLTNPPVAATPRSGDAPWRIELSVGQSTWVAPSYWDAGLFGRTKGVEVLAPSRSGHWSWSARLDIMSRTDDVSGASYVASGGFLRRFVLVPGWLAADAGIGGGFEVRLLRFVQDGNGGGIGNYLHQETYGPFFLGQVSGSLAFVRLPFAEIVTGARIVDSPDWSPVAWKVPLVMFSAGLRIALQ